MTTSRLIDATADTNYVIPAIMVDKDKYYQQYAVHIGAIIGKESDGEDRYASFCGQDYCSWMKEVTVSEAPEITCKKCLHIMRNLANIKDSESVHTVVSTRLNTRLQKVHVKKEYSNHTNSEPVNPLEEEPVDRVLGEQVEEPVPEKLDRMMNGKILDAIQEVISPYDFRAPYKLIVHASVLSMKACSNESNRLFDHHIGANHYDSRPYITCPECIKFILKATDEPHRDKTKEQRRAMVKDMLARLLTYGLASPGMDNEEYEIAADNLMLLQKSVAL